MAFRSLFRACVMALAVVLSWSCPVPAGEMVNFGIGRMVDPATNPDEWAQGQYKPTLLKHQNVLYCLWTENVAELPCVERVAMSISSDYGNTWSEKTAVLNNISDLINTVAGTSQPGYSGDGGAATEARLMYPEAAMGYLQSNGQEIIFVADSSNNRIRTVNSETGIITTIAGTGMPGFSGDGGVATEAQLDTPIGLAYSGSGILYVADFSNNRVRRIDSAGIITTVAGNGGGGFSGDGGPATEAQIRRPFAIALDNNDNLYICDHDNKRVRKVDLITGTISTVAGGGNNYADNIPATEASITPNGIAINQNGDLYLSCNSTYRVRKVDAVTGLITTVAGTGGATDFNGDGIPATAANLNNIHGIAFDRSGNLLIADTQHNRVRKVDGMTGLISTVAGNGEGGYSGDGGHATAACLEFPEFVSFLNNSLLITDCGANVIRRIEYNPPVSAMPPYAAGIDNEGRIVAVTNDFGSGTGGFRYAIYQDGAWREGQTVNTPFQYTQMSLKLSPGGELFYLMTRTPAGDYVLYKYDISADAWDTSLQPLALAEDGFTYCIDSVGKIYLFTGTGSIKVRISTDDGNTWEGPYTVAGGLPAYRFREVFASVSPDGKVDLTWTVESLRTGHVYIARCQDGHADFSKVTMVDKNYNGRHNGISYVKTSYGDLNENEEYDIFITWMEDRYASYQCYEPDYIAKSADGGTSFGNNFRVTWGDYNAECATWPSMELVKDEYGNSILVHIWDDDRNHETPNAPPQNRIYFATGRIYTTEPQALVVDDDNSSPPVLSYDFYEMTNDYYNYEAWYIDSLYKNGITYDYYDLAGEQHLPSLEYLKKFKIVLWETGLEYNEDPLNPATLSLAEQELLKSYLDWGGKLFLSSQDFLRDITAGVDGPVTNTFANNYLSVNAVENFFGHGGTYYGVASDPIGDGLTLETSDTIHYVNPITGRPYFNHFFNLINTKKLTHTTNAVFRYNGGDVGIRKSANPYTLLFLAYPFETIDQYNPISGTDSTKEDVMAKSLTWLNGAQGYVLSKSHTGFTDDRLFGASDTVYISMWSDRLDESKCKKDCYANLVGPAGAQYVVTMGFNQATGRMEGAFSLAGKPAGDWSVAEINIQDNYTNRYKVADIPFNVESKLDVLNPVHHEILHVATYPVNLRLTGGSSTVTVYYYNIITPDTLVFIDSVNIDASTGPAVASIDFIPAEYSLSAGDELGIYAETTGGNAAVAARSTGTIEIQ